ncbi:Predicted dithiol-disulfide isomerase, DsbA family [Rhizobium sp. RU20A]|uniref:DsbA family oxidoreductase n=1 Tax=Rhizobium sp. RU20A TaxID=1907412 RepID=UPI000956AD03|nr:DsbA family oxidoreductase [Rhizobium sp. RU20A]SIQ03865.1 Predicted dithiol-disulfide isomerase, DsbA family [Rhizobium sp. RU20A]
MKPIVTVDVVSDVVCPWCYLGKARLDQAVRTVSTEVDVIVRWRPYQLNPDLPPEGVPHKPHLAAKLGGQAAVDRAQDMLRGLGREAGIDYQFDKIEIEPNTLDAHRLLHWAATGGPEQQNAVASALFKANFEEGRDVGDEETLLAIAESAGMERAVVARLLESDADRDTVSGEIDAARQMGVSGVPCFVLQGKYAVMGAQSVETLEDAIRQVGQEGAAG